MPTITHARLDHHHYLPRSYNVFVAQGEFDEAVSLLLPLRYHLDAIGGSKAQQDVVHLTLLDAALRIPEKVRCSSPSSFHSLSASLSLRLAVSVSV